MKATLRLPRAATYADYLAVEEHSERRHELIDGVIVAMAGGSDEHNAIAGRLAMLIGTRLSRPCRYYTPDQRFWIAAHGRSRYADGSIICGPPSHPVHDGQATINPTVVVEVLSPSSEGDDDGEKRRDFETLESLRAYVLVAQDARVVKIYRRAANGDWAPNAEVHGNSGSFALPSCATEIAVDDLFDDILDPDGVSLLR
jgi:Uma2 family endonuclease